MRQIPWKKKNRDLRRVMGTASMAAVGGGGRVTESFRPILGLKQEEAVGSN